MVDSPSKSTVPLFGWSSQCDGIAGTYVLGLGLPVGDALYGYALTPTACRFFEIDSEGKAVYCDGLPVALDHAFEMRVFSKSWELRWQRTGLSARMSVLSDVALDHEHFRTSGKLSAPRLIMRREGQQFLWGKVAAAPRAGVSKLTSQRVGALEVPFSTEAGTRLALRTVDYFAQDEDSGNWAFLTTRLAGFTVAVGATPNKSAA